MVLQLMVKRHLFHIMADHLRCKVIFPSVCQHHKCDQPDPPTAGSASTARKAKPDRRSILLYAWCISLSLLEAIFICMERVTILHDEFAPSSGQTGVEFHPGTWFEFGRGEGATADRIVTRNCRDHFFCVGPSPAFLPVCEGEHNALSLGVGIPATGFAP